MGEWVWEVKMYHEKTPATYFTPALQIKIGTDLHIETYKTENILLFNSQHDSDAVLNRNALKNRLHRADIAPINVIFTAQHFSQNQAYTVI